MCTQSDARRRRDPGHVDRGGAVRGGPVPELAVAVGAPALDRAACQQGARVCSAQSQARRVRDSGHVDGGVAVCRAGPVSELAECTPAPALDRAACQQGARVCTAQSQTRRVRDSGHVDGVGVPCSGGPVSELAVAVGAPALDRAACQQGARVPPAAQSEACRVRDPGHFDGVGAVRGGPIPELAVVVVAPALDRSIREQGARMTAARRDIRHLGKCHGSEHRKRNQPDFHFVVSVCDIAPATRAQTDVRRI